MPVHDWTKVPAGIFHDFHHEWIAAIKRSLNDGILPSHCYALSEQVVSGLGPDVLALEMAERKGAHAGGNGSPPNLEESGIALATAPPKVRFTDSSEIVSFASQKKHITIRHVSDHRVLAILEIVSPGNKSSSHAMRSFVDKSLEFLGWGIHLLIVDLFPPTPRDPQGVHGALWGDLTNHSFTLPPGEPLTAVSYSAGALKQAFIEPFRVGAVLPEMPLFIEAERYVPTPLEATYQEAFAAVPKYWQEEL